MTMEPEDFIDQLLLEKVKMKVAFCGFNYHFGYKAKGQSRRAARCGSGKGI